MNENLYTTKTAALKATIADIRRLNSKKIFLNGKNILDYISDSEFNSYDTRDPQLKNDELDIWNTAISLSDNSHIEVKPLSHTVMDITANQINTLNTAVKVIDNEVLGTDNAHLMYWQTNGLTNSEYTFSNNQNLTTFSSDLSSLTSGYCMFNGCNNLTSFSSDLSSLTNGEGMFCNCNNLTAFTSNLSSLTNGSQMFCECINNLTTFSSDLSSLTNGYNMFYNCTNLTSFSSNLSSLWDGLEMFYNCKLDSQSVANIVHTLQDLSPESSFGNITIGIGCDATEEDQLLFAQECDCDTWEELLDEFILKNWYVEFQCNGRPTTTYNMRRGETLPIYTKLEEVTDEKYYQYTSTDSSKFYNIRHFHSTNGSTEGYDVFSSLEEAISTYNVTPKN